MRKTAWKAGLQGIVLTVTLTTALAGPIQPQIGEGVPLPVPQNISPSGQHEANSSGDQQDITSDFAPKPLADISPATAGQGQGNADNHQTHAAERDNPKEGDGPKITDWVQAISAAVTFLATLGLLYVGGQQLRTYKEQAKLMGSQLAVARATVPRAWLYAEFNEPGPKVITQGGNIAVIPFSIRNHGTTPATITQVDLRYYFGGFDDGKIFNPEQELITTPFEVGEIGKPTAPIPGAVECKFTSSPYIFDGTTISPNQSAPEESKKSLIQIGYPAFKQSGHAGFRGKEQYIFVVIKYSDPNGFDRETSYLGHVRANDPGQIVQSNDPRYSYHR